ncbi:hypothetical protein MPNT_280013 [Candidatus Methylacidithermus pantelleriae]|uniref:Uncharacterized protein n=1 Tax=Candidatus Methylacidithermus pantelleriae TaxID=2744239 RepID=A0A8J2BTR0_9BACT|nr:hypothetical protein MPNT_280013 [Candidatus Methylacidithermus pantelleriae]
MSNTFDAHTGRGLASGRPCGALRVGGSGVFSARWRLGFRSKKLSAILSAAVWRHRARVPCAPGPELEGKIAWIAERRPADCGRWERIGRAETVIRKLEENKPGSNVLHEKKRQLAILWRDQA